MSGHPFGDAPKERRWFIRGWDPSWFGRSGEYFLALAVGLDEYAYATSRDERDDD